MSSPTHQPALAAEERTDLKDKDFVDDAIPVEARASEVLEYTAAENRRVRWKIDAIVLPCIVIASMFRFHACSY